MARINIEVNLLTDPRFEFLKMKVGNEFIALGMVLKAFVIAQRFWLKDQQLIPEKIWSGLGLDMLIECDLAERSDEGIYVRGSKEQFDWLLKKQAAGKKSALVRLAQFGSSQPKKPEQCSSSVPNTSRTVFDTLEPPTPTPTLLNSFSQNAPTVTKNCTEQNSFQDATAPGQKDKKPREQKKSHGAVVWNAYSAEFQRVYGVLPLRNAKQNALCARLVSRVGEEEAPFLVVYFFAQNDKWLVDRRHPLDVLVAQAEKFYADYSFNKNKIEKKPGYNYL